MIGQIHIVVSSIKTFTCFARRTNDFPHILFYMETSEVTLINAEKSEIKNKCSTTLFLGSILDSEFGRMFV